MEKRAKKNMSSPREFTFISIKIYTNKWKNGQKERLTQRRKSDLSPYLYIASRSLAVT